MGNRENATDPKRIIETINITMVTGRRIEKPINFIYSFNPILRSIH